jgi:hypothetical protein
MLFKYAVVLSLVASLSGSVVALPHPGSMVKRQDAGAIDLNAQNSSTNAVSATETTDYPTSTETPPAGGADLSGQNSNVTYGDSAAANVTELSAATATVTVTETVTAAAQETGASDKGGKGKGKGKGGKAKDKAAKHHDNAGTNTTSVDNGVNGVDDANSTATITTAEATVTPIDLNTQKKRRYAIDRF